MKSINKITLLLLISCGYHELYSAASIATPHKKTGNKPISLADHLKSNSIDVLPSEKSSAQNIIKDVIIPKNKNFDLHLFPVEKDAIALEISTRANLINNDTIEEQLNRLIRQNYKTDQMKYNILLLMNQNPFMVVNIATASIENLPTIDQVMQKSYEKNIDKTIKINGLKSASRAINGAIADDKYDNQSFFAAGIATELNEMKKRVSARLSEIDPISNFKYYAGSTGLAALAATAGVYYYGITSKDAQDYVVGLGKGIADYTSKNIGAIVNSTTGAIQSAASSAITTASSSVNALANSAAAQVGTAINGATASIGSALTSAAPIVSQPKK